MGVQQIIANNTNALIDADIIASTVTPSADITRTGLTRSGTGLVALSGLYTGHVSADYDIEIVTGEGNGRSSAPVFSGVGSGTLSVTGADIPAQDVTVTLLTPPYPGATAEARIGTDIIKAVELGNGGNMINLQVNRSGLSFTASGSSTLEDIAEGSTELTSYKWDIPGVVCSADLKGNVPADAPRVRFGADPTIYRVVKDSRSGSIKTLLSPEAVRSIPAGSAIWIVSGTYSVTVTDGTNNESYSNIVTGYDLLSQLLSSTIVQPAYTPAPVNTAGGNAAVDLPLVTGSTALLTSSSSAAVRPAELTARTTAYADTITMQSKGNGSWGVTGASGTVYPDAFEGQIYAPTASPVILTIPTRPQPSTATNTQPVFIADKKFATRSSEAALPIICIDGALGINASPKSITAVYTKKPIAADCPCPTDTAYWSAACLGLTNSVLGEDIMALDPAYQTRLVALYQWEKTALGYDASIGSTTTAGSTVTQYGLAIKGPDGTWGFNGPYVSEVQRDTVRSDVIGTFTGSVSAGQWPTQLQLDTAFPAASVMNWIALDLTVTIPSSTTATYTMSPADIAVISGATQIMADCLSQIWGDSTGCSAWDAWTAEVKSELASLQSTNTLSSAAQYLNVKYQAGANSVLATAGIVPGKSDTVSGSTGCWQDADGDYWWVLSDGYAPAFTGVEYYSTRAGSFENSQEFGFMIKCGCEDQLLEGDTLTIQIGAGLASSVWSSNEHLEITTIPTTPLYLAGGKDPDDTEIWSVAAKDSLNVALPVFNADSTNRAYSNSGLEFTLSQGGISYSVGDRFTFTVEGGSFKWRKDGGAWSLETAIADGTVIDSGLTVDFLSGSAPSFVAGDSYSFRANQNSAATGLLSPDAFNWSWPDTSATITLTMPETRPISHLSLLHSLPAGTAIAVDYSTDGTTFVPLLWASGVVRDYLHIVNGETVTAKSIRITADTVGSIRWLWAGVPFQPYYSASLRIRKQYDMIRAKQSGSSVMVGEGTGATLVWDFLSLEDADSLLNMVRYTKANGDQPVIIIPQFLHPEEWAIGRLADDGIEINDLMEYQPDNIENRILSGSMEVTPEWR